MRYGVCVALLALTTLAAVFAAIGDSNSPGLAQAAEKQDGEKKDDKKADGPPPLVVDKNTPLLLEDPPEVDPFEDPPGPMADNESCFVCHANYKEEFLAVSHAKVNVGCIKCHGKSHAHRNDEDNVTPPDIMYPPEKIGPMCGDCHDEHDVPAREVITRWQECCPEKTDVKSILCTDCHGQHRLKLRSVRWNKTTGDLVDLEEDDSDEDDSHEDDSHEDDSHEDDSHEDESK